VRRPHGSNVAREAVATAVHVRVLLFGSHLDHTEARPVPSPLITSGASDRDVALVTMATWSAVTEETFNP
jgi:hypothetical protein